MASKTVGATSIQSAHSSKNSKLTGVIEVDIDKSGKFKYILVKIHDPCKDREFKHIVRGYSSCDYHADIYDTCTPDIESTGLDCECVGGGWIMHNASKKTIQVFGESQAYGRADHRIAVKLLQRKFPKYQVTVSADNY